MKKISIKLNKDLLDTYKFSTREYKNKDGELVKVREYEIEVILKDNEVLKTGDTWELVKVGFVTGKGVKQEDGKYSKEPIFGNATEMRDKKEINNTPEVQGKGIDMNEFDGSVNLDDIPF